ncbi:thioredoxin family protein [Martelella alba]|uniref:Thioredoxin n=1 Tax=Martelella alba TaxID=2590451 RepID=A0ABY2SDY6_9HYPH|nr:thioredoxin domain-containing protein [Martelella alba]TKI02279.1 thioredoxin [Martelella alba]
MMSVQAINQQQFTELQTLKQGVQLYRFWAPWCPPCRAMGPIYEQVAEMLGTKALFGEVNVDEEPTLSAAHAIRSIPTLVIYKDGSEVKRFSGLMNAKDLQALTEQYL